MMQQTAPKNDSQKNSRSKFLTAVIIAAILLNILLFVFFSTVTVGNKIIWKFTTELDLHDMGITDFSFLPSLKKLTFADLRGNDFNHDDYSEFSAALPECTILWSMPLGSQTFDNDSSEIKLSSADGLTASQLDALKFDQFLVSFDARGIDLPNDVLAKLNQLCIEMPQCTFLWDISLGGEFFPSDAESLTIPATTAADEFRRLLLFRNLKNFDMNEVGYSDVLLEIADQLSSSSTVWNVSVAGKNVLSTDTFLDVSGIQIDDIEAFSVQLSKLPMLDHVEMCGCGQTNEQMEWLMSEHPTIKFVWTISFARWTDVRTDILCFSCLNEAVNPYTEETFAPLFKYCKDLVALDLGHDGVHDISMISGLTNLQTLILADNYIRDISPLASLQKLEYLELETNSLRDISVLSQLPNLKILNITNNQKITDFSPLYELQNIEMLWMHHTNFSPDVPEKLQSLYPDCQFAFYEWRNTAEGSGWGAGDHRLAIKRAFKNWKYVTAYESWDSITYLDGAPLKEVHKTYD